MKKKLWLVLFSGMVSCGDIIAPPKKLLDEDKMSDMIAELAVNDQLSIVTPNFRINEQTVYIFDKEKIKAKDFTESYKYYLAKGKIEKILNKAQDKVMKMNPKAKEYINKKRKGQPSFSNDKSVF